MGLWNYGRKGTHDRESGSSSGRRRGSVKEEAASPPRQTAAPFSIAPRPAGHRDRQYLGVEVRRRYWETRMPVPWSDVHLPNTWHLSADRVPIPLVPTSGRARCEEIERRRRLLPDDLYYDPRFEDSGDSFIFP
ncbi:ADP-ribosylation factor-related protein 1 [Hordeum vulgare]|nr:ADP-ribosylation factor-related protein 1 [Hordeum vulgare]